VQGVQQCGLCTTLVFSVPWALGPGPCALHWHSLAHVQGSPGPRLEFQPRTQGMTCFAGSGLGPEQAQSQQKIQTQITGPKAHGTFQGTCGIPQLLDTVLEQLEQSQNNKNSHRAGQFWLPVTACFGCSWDAHTHTLTQRQKGGTHLAHTGTHTRHTHTHTQLTLSSGSLNFILWSGSRSRSLSGNT
jgi:hypothetical protein